MTMTMYHGSTDETLAVHKGLCLAADDEIARQYALYADSTRGRIHEAALDLDGLTVAELEQGHDWDANYAPGDGDEDYAADVIIFGDATAYGRAHITYRLMTDAALAALTVTGSRSLDGED